MKNKYHIYLTYEQRRMLLNNLNDFRNKLIAEGKYTDLLDEVIIKVVSAKPKRIKIRRTKNGNYIYNAG